MQNGGIEQGIAGALIGQLSSSVQLDENEAR